MGNEKMSTSQKRKIIGDWANEFRTLSPWTSRWLVQRHGPVLYGICLDGASRPNAYVPTVFAHCLAAPFPCVSLNGRAPVPDRAGSARQITWNMHADSVGQMAELLRQRHPTLRDGELSLDRLAQHVAAYLREDFGRINPFVRGPYEALALSAAAVGEAALAREAIDRAVERMQSWPATAFNIGGDPVEWSQSLRNQVADPVALQKVVASEVEKLGLRDIPDVGLKVGAAISALGF